MAMAASDYPDDALAYAADHMDVPEGFRVEIIEGNIIVSPTPQGRHGLVTSAVQYALKAAMPSALEAVQNTTAVLPETAQRYIPDLAVFPKKVLDGEDWEFSIHDALLVVEVTSPNNAETDRVKKLRGYARSRVPVYLLVDREERIVNLFTEPVEAIYRQTLRVPFGEKLPLPEPFAGEIDTSEFV